MVKIFIGIVHRVDAPMVITFDALHLELSHGTSCWSSKIRTKKLAEYEPLCILCNVRISTGI